MYDLPHHPTYQLVPTRSLALEPTLQPAAQAPAYLEADGPDPFTEILGARSAGLEELLCRLGDLVQGRMAAGAQAQQAISRDLTYLENLILDRYRHGQRATDDPTYVKLRLSQLHLHSEARQEEINRWRDTVLLAKEVAELARRAGEVKRSERLLTGGPP